MQPHIKPQPWLIHDLYFESIRASERWSIPASLNTCIIEHRNPLRWYFPSSAWFRVSLPVDDSHSIQKGRVFVTLFHWSAFFVSSAYQNFASWIGWGSVSWQWRLQRDRIINAGRGETNDISIRTMLFILIAYLVVYVSRPPVHRIATIKERNSG